MSIPAELRTDRLLLRPWRAADAAALLPILETNRNHLGPWIPKRVSEPAPIRVIEQRLADFGQDFAADRVWRFALFTRDAGETLGEVGLFPRSATGRVQFAEADRVEIGYWLRSDFTGRGFIAEAARSVLAVAAAMPQFSSVEIRCDARNAPSGAVAQRLGFVLAADVRENDESNVGPEPALQVWTLAFSHARDTSDLPRV